MAAIVDFDIWLVSEMNELSIDDAEVYSEYIKGVLEDENESLEDRKSNVVGILEGVIEDDEDDVKQEKVTTFAQKVVCAFDSFITNQKELQQEQDAQKRAAAESDIKAKLEALAEAAEAEKAVQKSTELSEEEKNARKRIINSYDTEVSDNTDNSLVGHNSNKAYAKQAIEQKKEADRIAARQHKKEIKAMQQKEKEVKDAKVEKRKAKPKKERRG